MHPVVQIAIVLCFTLLALCWMGGNTDKKD